MNYSTTEQFESKLAPGVRYKLRKMSHGRRIKLNAQTAPTIEKMIAFQREVEPLQEELKSAEEAAKLAPCTCQHGTSLIDGPPETAKDCHAPETGRCSVEGCDCRKPEYDPEKWQRFWEVREKQLELSKNELNPAYVRWGVQSVEGLEIDEEAATVESLIESAPEALVQELADEITRLIKMTAEEQLAFKSPTTLDAQVDGQTQISSAPVASSSSST
jgi:hypothetical protein